MMKRQSVVLLFVCCMIYGPAAVTQATMIRIDTSPNMYGATADYDAWWDATKAAVVGNTQVNQANSTDPANIGTHNYSMSDIAVYNFGDYGHRLNFIYWVPQTSISELQAMHFEVALSSYWDGISYDEYALYYGETWLEPTSWEEYAGGVIGTADFGFEGAHYTGTQGELDADMMYWNEHLGDVVFEIQSDEEYTRIIANHEPVPEPATMLLLGMGLAGLAGMRRRK